MKGSLKFFLGLFIIGALVAGYFLLKRTGGILTSRGPAVREWINNPTAHPDWGIQAGERCDGAVFLMPTNGLIGFLWDDSFYPGHRHSGLDIFGGTDPGVTPVIAAHDGYLSRFSDWKSTVIIRIPEDPLQPGRQIWTYYTHMADPAGNSFVSPEFPAGTDEVFVKAGTLLGYQGNFSGTKDSPVGVHLHFSIVLSGPDGRFRNETEIANTLDPSPYFNLRLNGPQNPEGIATCAQAGVDE